MTQQAPVKVKPETHKRLIGLAKYGDSMNSVIVKLLDYYEKKGEKK